MCSWEGLEKRWVGGGTRVGRLVGRQGLLLVCRGSMSAELSERRGSAEFSNLAKSLY